MKRIKPKYKVGDCFIIHNRWKKEFNRLMRAGIDPNWSFSYPFPSIDGNEHNTFMHRNIGTYARVIKVDIFDWPSRFDTKSYKIEFFSKEYWNLGDLSRDLVWIEEKDVPVVLDRKNNIIIRMLLRRKSNANQRV